MNDENYDITVVMPFKMNGERLFKIDERIKQKNQEELSVNREHKPVMYIFYFSHCLTLVYSKLGVK